MKTTDGTTKRGGRPATGKRGKFSFRVTDTLRERLEAESAATGRPVSEEIEMRLEASFRQPSPHSVGMLALIAATMSMIETAMQGKWTEDYAVAAEVREGVGELFRKYGPRDPIPEGPNQRITAALLRPREGLIGRSLVNIEETKPDDLLWAMTEVLRIHAHNRPEVKKKLLDYVQTKDGKDNSDQ